jgi:UDP-3-O-[3-hydroxymyristoyl] glucosamine N-acyltransferase
MVNNVPGSSAPQPLSLDRVAALVRGRVEGDAAVEVSGVAPVDEAGAGQLGFLALERYVRYAATSRAAALLVARELEQRVPAGLPRVVVDEPYPALRTLLERWVPEPPAPAEIHRTAILGRGVRLGEGVRVGPYAVLEDDVVVGEDSRIEAHCVVGRGAAVGRGCHLHPHVVVYAGSAIGSGVILHSGVRVGSDGFGYTRVEGAHRKIPQVGRCVIGDDVEIGANTTLDRGSLGDTVVGDGVKIDNLVQVAHNVRIGARSLLAALVGIAGSTRIGEDVWMGGQVSAINHLEIGDGARLAFGSTVMRDVPAGETVSGHPARPHREHLRRQAHLGRLPALRERVDRLEAALARLEGVVAEADDARG